MRKVIIAAMAVAAMAAITTCAVPAAAADLSRKALPVYKAPIAPAANGWSGCYIGANLGYGWQKNDPSDPAFPTFSLGRDIGSGIIGGGQLGCDYQFAGPWVIGLQGMFDGAGITGRHTVPFAYALDNTEVLTFKTDWFATLTGRIGYAVWPQTLLYIKAGGAWVHTNYTDVDPGSVPPFSGSTSAVLNGWIVGGGAEYRFRPHWSAFVEYNYTGLGTHNVSLTYVCSGAPCNFANPYPFFERHDLQAVLLGVNYRFQ
jgi:outer membrane immunogenic protein